MTATITRPAARALTDLVETARALSIRAGAADSPNSARTIEHAALTLDRARTRLVQEGLDYLDSAWAFVEAGRKFVADWSIAVDALERA